MDECAFTAVCLRQELDLVEQPRHRLKPAHDVAVHLVEILFVTSPRFVVCERLAAACPAHTIALEPVRRPVCFGTVLAAVWHRGAAATVPELVSGGGGRLAQRANPAISRACSSPAAAAESGLCILGVRLGKRVAEIVAYAVHAVVACQFVSGSETIFSIVDVLSPCSYCTCVSVRGRSGGAGGREDLSKGLDVLEEPNII